MPRERVGVVINNRVIFMAHSHSHDHHNHHHHTPATFNKAFALAVGLNLLFTIVEAGYAFAAHSMSLLADAGHNLADVGGLLMAWAASWLLGRAATEKYSYGYKKLTILAALANALLLVFASTLIVYESINKLLYPVAINETIIVVVAFVGILVNGGTALLFLQGKERDLNIKAAYWHLAADALISVSVVVAGILIFFTKWLWLDPITGLLIVIIILKGSWSLLRSSVDLILGAVPHGTNQQHVREYLLKIPGVTAIHDLHIWALSTQENALTAHLVMPEVTLTDEDYTRINHILQHDFNINHVTLQVEKGHVDNPCGQAEIC